MSHWLAILTFGVALVLVISAFILIRRNSVPRYGPGTGVELVAMFLLFGAAFFIALGTLAYLKWYLALGLFVLLAAFSLPLRLLMQKDGTRNR